MTLVLAIRCRDGVVLASDGQATTDAAGQPTRSPVRKLFDLGGRVAWGAAGSVGLQQTLAHQLTGLIDLSLSGPALRRAITDAVVPIQQRALRDFVEVQGAVAPDLSCIFCWYDHDGPWILSVPRTGSDHQLHDRYSAIGSGDIFAAFAMASVSYLGTVDLTLEQAKMVTYKAIADAIDVAAIFLGPPIQMYTVTVEGASEVPPVEVHGALSDSVDAWKERQRESLGALGPSTPRTAPLTVVTAAPRRQRG
jgi:20S proteasome alpha/beta subunit